MTNTTTPSTASQAPAVSICYDDEFRALLCEIADESVMCETAWEAGLVAYIDAKLAQARHEAWCEGVNIDALREENVELKARATAAEAKLESIRMAIDGLARFYTVGDEPVEYPDSDFLMYKDVSALFQSHPKADESGLPG